MSRGINDPWSFNYECAACKKLIPAHFPDNIEPYAVVRGKKPTDYSFACSEECKDKLRV